MNPLLTELNRLGFARYRDEQGAGFDPDLTSLARVTAEHKGAYDVANAEGEFRAAVPTRLMVSATSRDDYPAVGDWVVLGPEAVDPRVIDDILPRQGVLHKQYSGKNEAQLIAANVDTAFIVEAMDRDYSPNRFERYVVLAREGGVEPVIVLNKCDLIAADELARRVQHLSERFEGLQVITTSSVADPGIQALEAAISSGVTYGFLGSSGAGKSTLINRLLETDAIKTQEVGAKTGRGKHTTTGRKMHVTPRGAIIIDNPGSREVGVTDAAAGIQEVFDDVEAIETACRFTNCSHLTEPGCAVLAAIEAGALDAGHYHNFIKMRKEAEHFAATALEKRHKDKKFGKIVKSAQTDPEKRRP